MCRSVHSDACSIDVPANHLMGGVARQDLASASFNVFNGNNESTEPSGQQRGAGMIRPSRSRKVEWYGLIAVTKAGQINIPAQAQRSLGIVPESQVVAFGELDSGQLILAPPPPAGPLLDFITQQGRAVRSRAN